MGAPAQTSPPSRGDRFPNASTAVAVRFSAYPRIAEESKERPNFDNARILREPVILTNGIIRARAVLAPYAPLGGLRMSILRGGYARRLVVIIND